MERIYSNKSKGILKINYMSHKLFMYKKTELFTAVKINRSIKIWTKLRLVRNGLKKIILSD
jgi:hypothetical protein